jgi:hypothetical protein
MPLLQGKGTLSANIGELYRANAEKTKDKKRPRAQIVAIAESEARKK